MVAGLLIILIFVFVTIDNPSNQKTSVILTVSLKPSTVKVGEISRLTLEFVNPDLESHQISCEFNANPRVTINSGNDPLVNNEYSFILEASDPSEERILTVKALLEEGVSSTDYTIDINLFIDGEEIAQESKKLTLSVKES